MFAARYFPVRYFPVRFFPNVGGAPPPGIEKPRQVGRSWRELVEKVDGPGRHRDSNYPVVYRFSGGRHRRDKPGYD